MRHWLRLVEVTGLLVVSACTGSQGGSTVDAAPQDQALPTAEDVIIAPVLHDVASATDLVEVDAPPAPDASLPDVADATTLDAAARDAADVSLAADAPIARDVSDAAPSADAPDVPSVTSRITRIYTPDPRCERDPILRNACNGGTEIQTLLQPPGTTRVYLGTTNWNDATNRDAPAQVLYRDEPRGPWLRTGRLAGPSVGPVGVRRCDGFDQVNDLHVTAAPGASRLILAAVGSSFYTDADCSSHGNVFVSRDDGASWQSSGLEVALNRHVPQESSEARYILVHRDDTDACSVTPCVFAAVGIRPTSPPATPARFGGIWRARVDLSGCAATGGLCWDATPLIEFTDPDARSKSLKGNMVSVGRELFVPTTRCTACPEGPRIYRRDARGAWTVFYQASRDVEQIRALYYDEPTRRLFVAMNFDGTTGDRVYRFDTVAGALSARVNDEGVIASYPYQLTPFTRQGRRFLVATAAGRSTGAPYAALSIRPLDEANATWTILDIPSITDDPVVAGISTSLRFAVPSPWTAGSLLVGGYDATLATRYGTTVPHLTATAFEITDFAGSARIEP